MASIDRLTALVAGGVVLLVVVALAVAALSRGREAPVNLATPEGVVLAYVQAEERGDGQAAWNLLGSSVQARGDRDRFIARVGSGTSPRKDYVSTEAAQLDPGGQAASVVLVRTFPGSSGVLPSPSSSSRSTVRLVQESGAWRITVPPDDYALSPLRQP